MLTRLKVVVLASTLLSLLFAFVASAEDFRPIVDSRGEVAIEVVDRDRRPAVRRLPREFIEHFKRKYRSPDGGRYKLPIRKHGGQMTVPPFTRPSQPPTVPPYQQKQVVTPDDSRLVFEDWYNRLGRVFDSALRDEGDRAAKSRCNDVAITWSEIVSQIDNKLLRKVNGDIDKLSSLLSLAERTRYQGAAEAYDKYCLDHTDNAKADVIHPSYKNVVGVLRAKGVPFCGALRIGEDTFVTARHCFFFKNRLNGAPIEEHQDDVTVTVLSEPNRDFVLTDKFGPTTFGISVQRRFSDQEDYLFFKTEPLGVEMPPIREKTPSGADPLFLLGFFRFHQPAWVFGHVEKRKAREQWWRGLRWTTAPLCRTGPFGDRCLSHFCQSDRGFSGSPLLGRGGESPIGYFGIHIGSMGIDGNSCRVNTVSTAGNMAIRVGLSAVVEAASERTVK